MLLPLISAVLINTVLAAPIKPVSWTASSSAPEAEGANYEAKNGGDAKQSSFWLEGDAGSGLGASLQADFGAEKTLSSIMIWPGAWVTYNYWVHYNRPKLVVLEFSDGSTQEVTLPDEFKPYTVALAGKKTSSVKIRIKSVYNGDAFPDTAISEVMFFDNTTDTRVPVAKYSASSTFPADGDGTYEALNTGDGIIDSIWCEGDKAGDGTNQWLEFSFGSSQTVSQLVLRNGNAYSFPLYMKTNRGTAATLTFSDGSTSAITIKDSPSEQTISFGAHTTDKVRITFTTVKKGSEFNDMCVSEVSFLR